MQSGSEGKANNPVGNIRTNWQGLSKDNKKAERTV
jgi:hypothetical protein